MSKTRNARAAAMAAAVLMVTSPALAASAPAAAPAVAAKIAPAASTPAAPPAPEFGGPSIPGVCLLSKEGVITGSKLGIATLAKLKQLHQKNEDANAAAHASYSRKRNALAAQQATLPIVQFQQKEAALAQQGQTLQAAEEQRNQSFETTRSKALQSMLETAKPIIADVYRNRGCGVLFDQSAVMAGGLGMDLTATVIQALDAKITTPAEF